MVKAHAATAVWSGILLNGAVIHGQRTSLDQNATTITNVTLDTVFRHGNTLHGHVRIFCIDAAATDFSLTDRTSCYVFCNDQIFECNGCIADSKTAAVLRIVASGDTAIFYRLILIEGTTHNRNNSIFTCNCHDRIRSVTR